MNIVQPINKMFEYLSIFLGIDIDEMIDDILNKECKLLNKIKKIKLKKRKRKGKR